MNDLLAQSSDWLQKQRRTHMSSEVLYRRGDDTATVQATIGRTVFDQDDGAGAVIRTEVRDYLIDAADLVLAGEVTLPRRGDRIEETTAGQTFIYEVMSPGKEPAWRYSDSYRQTLRIHTKHVDTESSP